MRSKSFDIVIAAFLIAASIFLYSFLFFRFFIPIAGVDLNCADSLLYLAPGQRMYQGELIYRDVFEFVTPGIALVHFVAFRLFGLRPWIPNMLALILGVGQCWLGIVISRRLMRPYLALLPSGIFLVLTRDYLCDPTHHWYSVLAAIAAIVVLLERRTQTRIIAAGCLCGVSACFTQTRGLAAIVGFAVFLWWESRQRQDDRRRLLMDEAWLLTGFVATFLAVNAYFIWTAGWARYLWCTVVFVFKYYPKEADWNTFQAIKLFLPAVALQRVFLHLFKEWIILIAVPLTFILFFVSYWRMSCKKPLDHWERPMLVAIVGFCLFLSIAPAPNPNRMSESALPALILLGWFLNSPRRLARVLVVVFTVGTLLIAGDAIARSRFQPAGVLKTPQGMIAFINPANYQEYLWVQQHTRPSEYFYEADVSDLYFYLDLRNPTPLPRIVNNGYTTPEQVAEVIRGLEQHQVRYILWGLDQPDELPAWENPSDAHLGPLWNYMQAHYTQVKTFSNSSEIWERKVEQDCVQCDGKADRLPILR